MRNALINADTLRNNKHVKLKHSFMLYSVYRNT